MSIKESLLNNLGGLKFTAFTMQQETVHNKSVQLQEDLNRENEKIRQVKKILFPNKRSREEAEKSGVI